MKNPYPILGEYFKTFDQYQNSPVKLIIGEDHRLSTNILQNPLSVKEEDIAYYDGTIINIKNKILQEYFIYLLKTPILSESKILINDTTDLKILPVDPRDYLIGSPVKFNSKYVTPQLNERTLNELIQNNFKYKLNWRTGVYNVTDIDSQVKYFFKRRIRTRLLTKTGDELDRIADLSKIVLLLSKHIEDKLPITDPELLELLDHELEIQLKIQEILDKAKQE